MLVSRTTRTRRAHFLVDHVEELLLVVAGIAVLDAANREVQDLAAYRFVPELRQVALLAAGAGHVRADRQVCPVRNDQFARASARERVCRYVCITVVAGTSKKKK